MAVCENAIRALVPCSTAARRSFLSSPPKVCFSPRMKRKKPGWRSAGIAAQLGGGDSDPCSLLQSALTSASIRFQETLRPDPLFVDPYAGCFLTSASIPEEQCSAVSSPCHYRLATKFIDDKLLSLLSGNEELRQIVLLTDGMDTRPYRLKWLRSCVVFDVSPGRVFQLASERLQGVGAKISKTCILLHVPLEAPNMGKILCEKGFNGNRPSIWVLQGLPVMTLASLKDILFTINSLAMKGSPFIGVLPGWLLRTEVGKVVPTAQECMEKLFMSYGLKAVVVDCDEVARNLQIDHPSRDSKDVLFIAEQLQLSDAQMESWRTHFQRLEEEGDEEGFEEL